MFFFFLMSQSVGTLRSTKFTMFRPGPLPNIAQTLALLSGRKAAVGGLRTGPDCQKTTEVAATTIPAKMQLRILKQQCMEILDWLGVIDILPIRHHTDILKEALRAGAVGQNAGGISINGRAALAVGPG